MASKPVGQVQYFRSKIDGMLQPCAVCATDDSDQPKPLILEVSPGASASNVQNMVATAEQVAEMAAAAGHSCVVLRPTGRGPGSIYQNYGEVDLFEAVGHVCANYAIDPDRISVTGGSMGGAATWYLAAHYPDLFAAAAPFCGYCDYRLWAKPGGMTFHMHPWEEPSWQARSAALMPGNLQHTALWMTHGEWDRGVGGGVPLQHSLQMQRLLDELGIDNKLTIVPETGHGCRTPETWAPVVAWLCQQTKRRDPDHVSLTTFGLRHNSSYWLRIDRLTRYGQVAGVDARRDGSSVIVVTDNVQAVSLELAAGATVTIDGDPLPAASAGWSTFSRPAGGAWSLGDPPATQKRPGVSGPVGDIFFEPTILVPGASGTGEQTHYNDWLAANARGYFSGRNGGVHRGGIMGQNSVTLAVTRDTDLADEDLAGKNLLLYGSPDSNSVFKRFADELPISIAGDTIHLAGREYSAEGVAVLAAFPHPASEGNYIAVHAGATPEAITAGSHLDMMLLPDYVVYAGGEMLDWGFWGSDWR